MFAKWIYEYFYQALQFNVLMNDSPWRIASKKCAHYCFNFSNRNTNTIETTTGQWKKLIYYQFQACISHRVLMGFLKMGTKSGVAIQQERNMKVFCTALPIQVLATTQKFFKNKERKKRVHLSLTLQVRSPSWRRRRLLLSIAKIHRWLSEMAKKNYLCGCRLSTLFGWSSTNMYKWSWPTTSKS